MHVRWACTSAWSPCALSLPGGVSQPYPSPPRPGVRRSAFLFCVTVSCVVAVAEICAMSGVDLLLLCSVWILTVQYNNMYCVVPRSVHLSYTQYTRGHPGDPRVPRGAAGARGPAAVSIAFAVRRSHAARLACFPTPPPPMRHARPPRTPLPGSPASDREWRRPSRRPSPPTSTTALLANCPAVAVRSSPIPPRS